jgi:ankyrin repeat protein
MESLSDLLFVALGRINPGVTLMLLRSGARATTSCSKGDSLVSLATQDSSQEVISALIAEGAPVNCQDEHGQTALHWAAINGQADRVALLLKNGADGTLKNS